MQASFFDAEYGLIDSSRNHRQNRMSICRGSSRKWQMPKGKYNYLNPKKASVVPSEYVKEVVLRGTGFVGGRGRVCKILRQRLMQEQEPSVLKQSMALVVPVGLLMA